MERIIGNTITNLFHLHFPFYTGTRIVYDFKNQYIKKTKLALSVNVKQHAS